MSRARAPGSAAHKPLAPGSAAAGVVVDPANQAIAVPVRRKPGSNRVAPAPQHPIPSEEVERLKANAVNARLQMHVVGQPDPAAKPRRR